MVDDSYSVEDGIRLFSLFHAHTIRSMKLRVISQLTCPDGFLRVVFATTALGMGVSTFNVRHIVHISPPFTLEAYFQEVGRAGRDGSPSTAVLYFDNSDIATTTHVRDEMRNYCEEGNILAHPDSNGNQFQLNIDLPDL